MNISTCCTLLVTMACVWAVTSESDDDLPQEYLDCMDEVEQSFKTIDEEIKRECEPLREETAKYTDCKDKIGDKFAPDLNFTLEKCSALAENLTYPEKKAAEKLVQEKAKEKE